MRKFILAYYAFPSPGHEVPPAVRQYARAHFAVESLMFWFRLERACPGNYTVPDNTWHDALTHGGIAL